MQINNEIEMFDHLQSLAKQGVKEEVNKDEFLKGIEELKKSLFIIKLKEEGDTLIFEKMFDTVTVEVKEVDSDLLELKYTHSGFMEDFRNR